MIPAWGIAGWDASTALATESGAGVAGSAVTGVSVVVVFCLDAVPSVLQILTQRSIGNDGWAIRASSASFQCIAQSGAAGAIAPVRTLVAGDVGKIHVAAMTCNAAAVFNYFDRVQVGASTAMAAYAPAATNHTYGSTQTGSFPALSFRILGVAGRDSHLSLADYQTICDATKVAGKLTLGGITMEHQWNAPIGGSMPATLSDTIGTDHMTFIVGAAANVNAVTLSRVWGF